MQIDIPAHIEKLLFLHDALVIPGFGGFTATRTPASTDYVGGIVNPPAKTLAFSENLTVDDGLLSADIADAHGLTTEDARLAVEEFVEKMRELLDQREIVTLPGVGRLYKNYVQKIQFLPDATNFNASSYGLPPLQFSPIARSREVENTPSTTVSTPDNGSRSATVNQPYTPPTPAPPMPEETFSPERSGGSSAAGTALAIFLLLAALTVGIWYWQHRQKIAREEQKPGTETLAEKPKQTEDAAPKTPAKEETETTTSTEDSDLAAKESLEAKENEAREKLNLARNGRECILIIASLSDKNNADKLRKLLTEEDYTEFYQQNGKTHIVGIRFFYLKPSEIEDKKKALMSLTGVNFIAVKKK